MDFISEEDQKYSYEDYQNILKELAGIVKKYRNESIKAAQKNAFWQSLVDYPIKLLLGTSLSGGGIEGFGNLDPDTKWVSYTRTALEFAALILTTTKDFGKFEKKKQKYIQAQSLLSTFHNIVKQQLKIRQGFEGDREEIIKELTEGFENLKGSNIIIQELGIYEDMSQSSTSKLKRAGSSSPRRPKSVTFSDRPRNPAPKSPSAPRPSLDFASASSEHDSSPDMIELSALERGQSSLNSATRLNTSRKSMRHGSYNTTFITEMLDRI